MSLSFLISLYPNSQNNSIDDECGEMNSTVNDDSSSIISDCGTDSSFAPYIDNFEVGVEVDSEEILDLLLPEKDPRIESVVASE